MFIKINEKRAQGVNLNFCQNVCTRMLIRKIVLIFIQFNCCAKTHDLTIYIVVSLSAYNNEVLCAKV